MSESTGFKAQVSSIVTEVLQKLGIISKDKEGSNSSATAGEAKGSAEASTDGAITAEMRTAIESAVNAQVKPLQDQLGKAQVDLKAANETIAARDKEITDLKAAATTVDEAAAEKARKTTAAQGVPSSQLPAGKQGSEAESLESVRAAMATETDPEKRSQLATKARQLRGHGDMFGAEKK